MEKIFLVKLFITLFIKITLKIIINLFKNKNQVGLKKIYNFFAIEKENEKLITIRQFLKMAKELNFYENKSLTIDKAQIEIIYSKKVPNKMANFQNFIEILYSINKMNFQPKNTNNNKNKPKLDKYNKFKHFLDEILIKKFKFFSMKYYLTGIEKIQVFFNNYNPYHNATIDLFYECDQFLKHVLLFYYL